MLYETERTLAVFQGSDMLGFLSDMLHFYSASHSKAKQGHEIKCQKKKKEKKTPSESRGSDGAQTLHLSFHLSTLSLCV